MFGDHRVKFRHEVLVRYEFASIRRIDTHLSKGGRVGFTLGDAADRLSGEAGPALATIMC